MSTGRAPGRASTAALPAAAASRKATEPTGMRDRSQIAATAASTAITAITATERNNLSAVPKVRIAHSFTGPGVALMTAVPTAVRASAAGEKKAALSWTTPRATAAAATPAPMRRPVEVWAIRPTYRWVDTLSVTV